MEQLTVLLNRRNGLFNRSDLATADLIYEFASTKSKFKFSHQINKEILQKLKILYENIKNRVDHAVYLDSDHYIMISTDMKEVSITTMIFSDDCYAETVNTVNIELFRMGLEKILLEIEKDPLVN